MSQVSPALALEGFVGKAKTVVLNPFLLLSALCYVSGFVLYSIVLTKLELSRAYPVASVSTIVIILVVSALFLRESIGVQKMIGIALCLGGIVLIL